MVIPVTKPEVPLERATVAVGRKVLQLNVAPEPPPPVTVIVGGTEYIAVVPGVRQ